MLLSEMATQNTSDSLVYGAVVDADILTPPKGLKRIGLVYAGTETEPDDAFVDAIISFTLAGVEAIAEFEPHQNVDAQTMLTIAGNAGFSIALIPPTREEDVDLWCTRCADFATAYLNVPNFGGNLYPVSGFFGYLLAREVSGIDALAPDDPYTRQRFVEAAPEEWSNRAKAAMQKAWEDRVGGKDALRATLLNLAGIVVVETLDLLDRIMDASVSEPPAADA